jgi:hypothetical protein
LEASRGAFAANTERARYADLKVFAEWCLLERRDVLPVYADPDLVEHTSYPIDVMPANLAKINI